MFEKIMSTKTINIIVFLTLIVITINVYLTGDQLNEVLFANALRESNGLDYFLMDF